MMTGTEKKNAGMATALSHTSAEVKAVALEVLDDLILHGGAAFTADDFRDGMYARGMGGLLPRAAVGGLFSSMNRRTDVRRAGVTKSRHPETHNREIPVYIPVRSTQPLSNAVRCGTACASITEALEVLSRIPNGSCPQLMNDMLRRATALLESARAEGHAAILI